jgi:hypothetical protein
MWMKMKSQFTERTMYLFSVPSLKLVIIEHTKFVGFSYNLLVRGTDSRVL